MLTFIWGCFNKSSRISLFCNLTAKWSTVSLVILFDVAVIVETTDFLLISIFGCSNSIFTISIFCFFIAWYNGVSLYSLSPVLLNDFLFTLILEWINNILIILIFCCLIAMNNGVSLDISFVLAFIYFWLILIFLIDKSNSIIFSFSLKIASCKGVEKYNISFKFEELIVLDPQLISNSGSEMINFTISIFSSFIAKRIAVSFTKLNEPLFNLFFIIRIQLISNFPFVNKSFRIFIRLWVIAKNIPLQIISLFGKFKKVISILGSVYLDLNRNDAKL